MNELARFMEHRWDRPDQSRSMLGAAGNKGIGVAGVRPDGGGS